MPVTSTTQESRPIAGPRHSASEARVRLGSERRWCLRPVLRAQNDPVVEDRKNHRWTGPSILLVASFVVSRLAFYLAGVRYDGSVLKGTYLTDQWQLLDVSLLRNNLMSSVWHLNSQPPLFNVYCGIILKLPNGLQNPFEIVCSFILGLTIVLGSYVLLVVVLHVPRWAAFVVVLVGIVLDPAFVLFENSLSYAYPTAALAILSCLWLGLYLQSERWVFGLGFFGSASCIALLNSTYQIEWLIVASGAAIAIAARTHWRRSLYQQPFPCWWSSVSMRRTSPCLAPSPRAAGSG